MKPIYCIGDSHVSFFGGENRIQDCWPSASRNLLPYFTVFRLGPVLAYNLCQLRTTTQGRERLFQVLNHVPRNRFWKPKTRVLLSFGEIDCRAHVLKHADLSQRTVSSVVRECVERYFGVILEIKELGYETLIWNAIPSSLVEFPTEEFPTYRTCKERNKATGLFNKMLADLCTTNAIPFVSIFDDLIDENGLTRTEYYFDHFHLSQRAMPLTLKRMEVLEIVDKDTLAEYAPIRDPWNRTSKLSGLS